MCDDQDKYDNGPCPFELRVFCLILEMLASIVLGITGIVVYAKIYYNFEYPNIIFEQQIDTWNKEYITDFMFINGDMICEDIGD